MPGARNNRQDKQRIRQIRSLSSDITNLSDELGASDPEDDAPGLIAVKADMAEVDEYEVLSLEGLPVFARKASGGEWMLDVLGAPFGSASDSDSDKQWFDRNTKFYLDRFPTPPPVYYHGFEADGRPSSEPTFLGKTISHRVNDRGVWFRVELDQEEPMAKRVWDAALVGNAKASSGSIVHLARVAKSGHITVWPIAELSLFDTGFKRQPANQRAVVMPAVQQLYVKAGIQLDMAFLQKLGEEGDEHSDPKTPNASEKAKSNTGGLEMDEKEVAALVASQVAAALKKHDEEQKAQADAQKAQADEIAAQVAAALKAQQDAHEAELVKLKEQQAAARRISGLGGAGAPTVLKFGDIMAFDDLEIPDLAVAAGVLSAAKMSGRGVGPSENLRKAIAIRVADSGEANNDDYRSTRTAMKAVGMAVKANELNQSTLANYGDEWIAVAYSAQMWEKIRMATTIVGNLPTVVVPQGTESIVLPLSGASPTFFKMAQASAQDANPGRVTPTITTSRRGTGQQSLTVSKLGAAVNYTGELEEDSIIPWAADLRADLTAESAEILEHLVIDGDTATGATTNINDIAGTPAGTEAFLLFNGFRKLALVTNTANSRSGTTLTVEDFLETVKLMGLGGRNAFDRSKIGLIVDMATHWKAMELAEVKTRDVFSAPTIENGMLTSIYGYRVIPSPNMHRANQDATYGLKANSSGKVDLDTASNNTTGSILAVRWDQWKFGFKRRMTFEIDRDPLTDSTLIVATMRIGLVYRDTEASAISYNLSV